MGKVISIIAKNWKIIFRNRIAFFLLLFGPILLLFLLGIFVLNSQENYLLKVGVSDESKNELSLNYITALRNASFLVLEYSSPEACQKDLRLGHVHVCFLVPPNLKIEGESGQKIKILIDSSKEEVSFLIENRFLELLREEHKKVQTLYADEIYTTLSSNTQAITVQQNNVTQALSSLTTLHKELVETRSSLEKIHSSFTPELFNSTEIIDIEKEIESELSRSNALLSIKIDNLGEEIENLKSELDEINMTTSDKSSLKASLSSLETSLENMNTELEDMDPKSERKALLDFADKLDSAITKFSAILNEDYQSSSLALSSGLNTSETLNSSLLRINQTTSFLALSLQDLSLQDSSSFVNLVPYTLEEAVDEKKGKHTLILSLLINVVLVFPVFLASFFLVLEKKSPAFARNILTKYSSISSCFANLFSLFLLLFIQILCILFFINRYLLHLPQQIFLLSLLTLALLLLIFLLCGFLLGYLAKKEISVLFTSLLFLALLFFFSGSFIPLELFSEKAAKIASYLPQLLALQIFRKLVIFDLDFFSSFREFLYLCSYSIGLFILVTIFESISKKRQIYFLLFAPMVFFQRKKIRAIEKKRNKTEPKTKNHNELEEVKTVVTSANQQTGENEEKKLNAVMETIFDDGKEKRN
ncbi:ABC transporter permease [Candidatus Woesearchaeota archaeon]|nr:ABC transporter permease [Nanoarchaeota archaeon]MCB9370172.1 ABC transporter permease [Candidatus Woesearchaeota archaeon]USN44702.1 MAG: ABC transporter permease [Candidatus Woesearchaeota archaeon]